MQAIKLSQGVRRSAVLVLGLASTLFYLRVCWVTYRAETLGLHEDSVSVQAAARYQPANAEWHYRLGRLRLFADQDVDGAAKEFETATSLNPYSARYSLDLASAYQVMGDSRRQQQAVERALAQDPTNPQVAWTAAAFKAVSGDSKEALSLLRVVVANEPDPAQVMAAMSLAWRIAQRNPEAVLEKTIPPVAKLQFAFLSMLLENREYEAADVSWQRIRKGSDPYAPTLAFPYIDSLVQRHKPDEAIQAWDDVIAAHPSLAIVDPVGNIVADGDFEHGLIGGGFRWTRTPVNGLTAELDQTQYHSANHSLAIVYSGERAPDAGVYRLVPVKPSSCYSFSAFIKTEELEGANGVRIVVADPYGGRQLLLSDEQRGSRPWEQVQGSFQTAADARMVVIRIVVPGNTLVKGTAWIDDVSVVPSSLNSCLRTPGSGSQS